MMALWWRGFTLVGTVVWLAALPAAYRVAEPSVSYELDTDVELNTPQTIRKNGYPAESHTVETADGYLLTMHRIPGPRYPTPLLGSSTVAPTSSSPTAGRPRRRSNRRPARGATDSPATPTSAPPAPVRSSTYPATTTASPASATPTQPPVSTTEDQSETSTASAPPISAVTAKRAKVAASTIATTLPPEPAQGRPVVFLQHGLLGSSYDWIIAGRDKGLAYLLADAGFDVWMGNARGNTYSRAHVYLPTESSSPFWDFSFHEMGIYDLPAELEYVLNATGRAQLHYVGHSMGTTMLLVLCAMKPEAAAVVAAAHALAPVAFVGHIKSPIRLLAPFAQDAEFLARLLGDGEFLPQNKVLHYLAKYGCELLEAERDVCENLLFVLCGYDRPQFQKTLLPALLSHTPAGASTRTLIHYAQMIKSGKFQQYDFGKYTNLKKYGTLQPPSYDLSIVNVTMNLVHSSNDWLASLTDVNTLYQTLQCKKSKYLVPFRNFNHLDFILAKDVKTMLYDKLLKEIPHEIDYPSYEDNFLYE